MLSTPQCHRLNFISGTSSMNSRIEWESIKCFFFVIVLRFTANTFITIIVHIKRNTHVHVHKNVWHSYRIAEKKINLSTVIHFSKWLSYRKLVCLFIWLFVCLFFFFFFFRPLFSTLILRHTSNVNPGRCELFIPLRNAICCSINSNSTTTTTKEKAMKCSMLDSQTSVKNQFLSFFACLSQKSTFTFRNWANVYVAIQRECQTHIYIYI